MKNLVIVGAFAATLLATFSAEARPVGRYERWCLNLNEPRSGGSYQCNYATQDQCMASRSTNGEWCMLNPELQGERQYR